MLYKFWQKVCLFMSGIFATNHYIEAIKIHQREYILDNIFAAWKWMQRAWETNQPTLFKIDFNKAYYQFDWIFTDDTFHRLRFGYRSWRSIEALFSKASSWWLSVNSCYLSFWKNFFSQFLTVCYNSIWFGMSIGVQLCNTPTIVI